MKAETKAEVSETVELMSILSRLANYEEFCSNNGGSYVDDINSWFGSYKNHETVQYHQRLRNNNGIAYDRVASMGVHLVIENGTLKIGYNTSLFDSRWLRIDLDDYVRKLNNFYKDTHFHDFYVAHQDYYNVALSAYNKNVIPYFKQDWYAAFYGTEPNENFFCHHQFQ